jgi:phosphate acyltransferase
MKTLVVDMMGSDHGSKATAEGVLLFLKRHPDVKMIAVGKIEELKLLEGKCELIDARDVVPMEAGAMEVMRMRNSSMMVAINTLLERQADALVGAGSTGAFLSAATLKIKLIEGVERAALVSPFPTAIKGKKVTILDIGANNENTPSQLVQFAKMGRIYTQQVMKIAEPKVYLLSNGAEDKKGSPEVKEANHLLRDMSFPGFSGNVEARDALNGAADVIVTGGFAGNVFLKGTEGIAVMMNAMIKHAFKRTIFAKLGYLLAKKGFQEMKATMDYKTTGGAMLLGVNSVVVKGHGSSDGFSFSYALEVAYKMAEGNVIGLIREGMKVHE